MKALVLKKTHTLGLEEVATPAKALPGHLLIKMEASAINSGDKLFISGAFPRGIPCSKYNIAGVSGVGKVIDVGENVPGYYKDESVTVYRSLRSSDETTGTWSDYAHLHYLNCAVIPKNVDTFAYAGSLVNIITPYSFLQEAIKRNEKGIICTAGNSATGIAMLGLCLLNNVPVISIVRTEKGKKELEALGALHILVQTDAGFKQQLQQLTDQLNITSVFDGAGGATLGNIINVLPYNTTIYCYGFLDNETELSFYTTTLMRGITIKGFSNFRTPTVQDDKQLEEALVNISSVMHQQYFKTRIEKHFYFNQAEEAMRFSSHNGSKAVFIV